MKKTFFIEIMALVILITCVLDVSGSVAYGKSKNSKAKAEYAKILSNKKKAKKVLSVSFGYGSDTEFALLDINGDGVKELLFTPDGGYHIDIIAYIGGKVKNVGTGFSGSQKYYSNKHIYFSHTRHTGDDEYAYYEFTGKIMKMVAEKYGCDWRNAVTGKNKPYDDVGKTYEPYRYTVMGKQVSKKKYNLYVKKLLSGAKSVKPKWHKNTNTNREKYLFT